MKVAVVTDLASIGGAGVAASRLCVGLRRRGHQIARLHDRQFEAPPETADQLYPLALPSVWRARLNSVLKFEPWRRFAQHQWRAVFHNALEEFQPDVISLHNIHGAGWDIEIVRECLDHAPVIWTMHDSWPLTGSCAVPMACQKFLTSCDRRCPQLGSYPTLPAYMISGAHQRRKSLFRDRPPLMFVAPSRWMAERAQAVTAGEVPVYRISFGLDAQVFRPMNRAECRRILGIPEDSRPLLLASAAFMSQEFKGKSTLAHALRRLPERPMRLMLMGSGTTIDVPSNVEVSHLGRVSGDRFLALVYNAADLFVHPSHADNQPLVVMEAHACGLPVVALPVEGVPEMIEDGQTGWLAHEATEEGLAEALRRALNARPDWAEIGSRGRAVASAKNDLLLQADRYAHLFRAVVARETITQETLDSMSIRPAVSASGDFT